MIIDVHTHYFPESWFDLIRAHSQTLGVKVKSEQNGHLSLVLDKGSNSTALSISYLTFNVSRWCHPEIRLDDMNNSSIDVQVLSPPRFGFYFKLDRLVNGTLSRSINDGMSDIVRTHPSRFWGLASVPLFDMDYALTELERAIADLDLRGLAMATNMEGVYLDDKFFWPLYERAQAYDIPIFVHPNNPPGVLSMSINELTNLVGFPFDTTLCIARLMLSGVLDQFPKLKLLFAHGGGAIAFTIGRLDHGFLNLMEARSNAKCPPSIYLKRLFYDTLVFDTESLTHLIKQVGQGQVLVGSDYPASLGVTLSNLRHIVKELPIEEYELIARKNAAGLFGIPNSRKFIHKKKG